ncbi:unknown [Sulfolobus spindle-shaped virus 6]|uniref:RH3 domain-containing protein n=1 Tax=Sulfolobus spindle-shaped virus 6 TaxID=693627 RepID=D1GF35_9VIRU|nr:Arc-like repressor [Sulfolobus spindle-shaped virus 6]ACZ35737.1 unknown [Sulfolobus spindle-shaped virus 6]
MGTEVVESKKITKKKTTLAFDEDVYQVLKLVSVYLNRDMTEIIEEAVVMWLIQNKEKLPNELKPKIDEIGKRFFPAK